MVYLRASRVGFGIEVGMKMVVKMNEQLDVLGWGANNRFVGKWSIGREEEVIVIVGTVEWDKGVWWMAASGFLLGVQ